MSEALKKNELKKEYYAYLVDRILIEEGKKQLYGSQLKNDPENGLTYFDMQSVENINNIDIRRKEYDMEPIADYLERSFHIEWDLTKLRLYPKKQ